ncbi:MAG: hypothetical protein ACT4P4_24880 [Betaproteobacteria bacterium]
MRMRTSAVLMSAAAAALSVGCSPQPATPAAAINDKVYAVSPDAMKVASGLLSGEISEMKVTERVEAGTGRVTTPAKLSGKLVLRNVSKDQTLRLVGGKILYIDFQGKPIALEDNRVEPTVKLAQGYGSPDRLDPGQDATHGIDAEFPVEALKAKRLKEVRLELIYIPSPIREESLRFAVSVSEAQ